MRMHDFSATFVSGGGNRNFRGNQHNKKHDSEVTPQAMQKRVMGRLATARQSGPQKSRDKWAAIVALKGVRGANIFALKREYLMTWVKDPTWDSLPDVI